MRIVRLDAENFKRLRAVRIEPDGSLVTISGRNGAGKSSVLDAIWVALEGKRVAPPMPIRAGEDRAVIRLDMGQMVVTRTFTRQPDGEVTMGIRVESPEGLRYPRPESVLEGLLGAIGFDPFEFMRRKPVEQAEALRELVPLSIDLDEFAAADEREYISRRDINRDAAALRARVDGVALPAELPPLPDRDALMAEMSRAAERATEIASRHRQESELKRKVDGLELEIINREKTVTSCQREIERIQAQISDETASIADVKRLIETVGREIEDLPPVPEPIDTAALEVQIRGTDEIAALYARKADRDRMEAELAGLVSKAQALTDSMAAREAERAAAMAEAQMPVPEMTIEGAGKAAHVRVSGIPFEQVNTAEQLRISTKLAMAANPELRVLRVRDGSSLDSDSLALLAEMADQEGYQVWVERVADGGAVGIVIEDGMVAGAEAPEPIGAKPEKPKRAAAKKPADGALL